MDVVEWLNSYVNGFLLCIVYGYCWMYVTILSFSEGMNVNASSTWYVWFHGQATKL